MSPCLVLVNIFGRLGFRQRDERDRAAVPRDALLEARQSAAVLQGLALVPFQAGTLTRLYL